MKPCVAESYVQRANPGAGTFRAGCLANMFGETALVTLECRVPSHFPQDFLGAWRGEQVYSHKGQSHACHRSRTVTQTELWSENRIGVTPEPAARRSRK